MTEHKEEHSDHRASIEAHLDHRHHRLLAGAASLATNPNAAIIANFLTYFTLGNAHYGHVGDQNTAGTLMTLFSGDDTQNPLNFPIVGITDHGDANQYVLMGPGFVGQAEIQILFNQLFTSFAALAFVDIGFPWMSSDDQKVIAVRLNLQGTQQHPWFAPGHPKYSLPLSELSAAQKPSIIPTCAVFTFNNSQKIVNLALYMDRYKLMSDLQSETKNNFEKKLRNFLKAL
jgi:hypothetical protein